MEPLARAHKKADFNICAERGEPMSDKLTRCDWAAHDILNQEYHDNEWGKPVHDDRTLFKMLILEGMQAGLSWITILKKRDAFIKAFDDFDPAIISTYGDEKIEELMQNAGIIRNRLKINAAITNARAYFVLCEKYGSLDQFLWSYVDNKPIKNAWETMADVPASTPLAEKISKDLKNLGFKFVGPTIIYAYMQSVGLVNDHMTSCFCYNREK